jgi:hypothetical protein
MASLRDQYSYFYTPDEHAVETAMQTGMVTPDANVLLSLYRFQPVGRDELFGALKKTGDRLWVPHQVGLEFHKNRLNVMAEQEGYFTKTLKELEGPITELESRVRAFRARIALDEEDVRVVKHFIAQLRELISDAVARAQESNDILLKDHDSDKVLARIEALLGDRVGEPVEPKELEAARKEADRRIKDRVPPGYMDHAKADPAGDYLVWRQLMTEATKRKVPVVLITDDRKEDWYRREQGLTLGARYELRREMLAEAGVPLLVMTTETFLVHARKYLDAEVSPETVDQAKELPGINTEYVTPMRSRAERLAFQELRRNMSDPQDASRYSILSYAELMLLAEILAQCLPADADLGTPSAVGFDQVAMRIVDEAATGGLTRTGYGLGIKTLLKLRRARSSEEHEEPPSDPPTED